MVFLDILSAKLEILLLKSKSDLKYLTPKCKYLLFHIKFKNNVKCCFALLLNQDKTKNNKLINHLFHKLIAALITQIKYLRLRTNFSFVKALN